MFGFASHQTHKRAHLDMEHPMPETTFQLNSGDVPYHKLAKLAKTNDQYLQSTHVLFVVRAHVLMIGFDGNVVLARHTFIFTMQACVLGRCLCFGVHVRV